MKISNLIELACSLGLELWLLVLLFRRDVQRHFPIFSTYVAVSVPVTVARLISGSHYQLYFYVFWSTNAVLLLVGLAALHEIFRWVYAGFYEIWWFRLFYYGAIIFVLLIALRNAAINPPVQAHPLIGFVLNMGIAVNLLQAGIACVFFALLHPLGIEFRRYPFGITLGFLLSATGSLLGYLARSVFGTNFQSFAKYASPVAYILGLLIWLSAFILPEIKEEEWSPPISPERMLEEVRGYLKALGFRGTDKNDER
jgi:hypothetical protein